ncbi:secreted protein [gut metagenome]|uniref:Secreted protein n=1 Tax=gut metagenome TaxID=749906 RepID=J9G5K0_9ZZZZ
MASLALAISCTVSWIASSPSSLAFLARSILPLHAPHSASTRICRLVLVLSVRTSPNSSANLAACSASSKA